MRLLSGLVLLIAVGALAVAWILDDRASLEPYQPLLLDTAAPDDAPLTIRFFGVTSVLIDDGETALMTDGFFTRPGLLRLVFTRIRSDKELIRLRLEEAGVDALAAVLVQHSHFDHALDAPEVARQTGALLVGSESTANIGRGGGLPESQLHVVDGRETITFGRFRVTLVPTAHIPHGLATGTIDAPLVPPAHALTYREGGNYTIVVEHPAGNLLVQGGGFVPGALDDVAVDVALIGTTGTARAGIGHAEDYWRHVVRATGARRVIPVHWDDFTRPLDAGLMPFSNWIAPFDQAMAGLLARAMRDGVDVRLLLPGIGVDPFAGLGDATAAQVQDSGP